jgi:hypothetical protein
LPVHVEQAKEVIADARKIAINFTAPGKTPVFTPEGPAGSMAAGRRHAVCVSRWQKSFTSLSNRKEAIYEHLEN